MGSSGAVRGTSSLTLTSTPVAAAAIPAATLEGLPGVAGSSTWRRGRKNLTANWRWRIVARVSTAASAAAKATFQWSLDQTTWFWPDGVAGGSAPGPNAYVSMAAAVTLSSNWIPIPSAARADVWVRGVTLDGDGTTTGSIGQFIIEFD